MRVLMVNVVIGLLSVSQGQHNLVSSGPNIKSTVDPPGALDILDIMKNHFDLSLDYLYTGVQYESQYLERPGLAKKLRGMSDAQWEAGMGALNKFLEHGGLTNHSSFIKHLDFSGGEKANLNMPIKGDIYLDTLSTLNEDSQKMLGLYNNVYKRVIRKKVASNIDGDLAHYLEEKIEKEVEHSHELKGHITTLSAMKGIGAAVAAFDSNL